MLGEWEHGITRVLRDGVQVLLRRTDDLAHGVKAAPRPESIVAAFARRAAG